MEYESVLIVCLPVAGCVKTEKSASSMLLAVLTGICTESQSPAEDRAVACSPFVLNHALTAEVDSSDGVKYASTCRGEEDHWVIYQDTLNHET